MISPVLRAASLVVIAAFLSHCGPSNDATETTSDEPAIRDLIASYAKAFEAGDVEAIAAHWSDDGVYHGADGTQLTGRDSISEALAKTLADAKGAKLIITLNGLAPSGPNAATGEGMALVYLPTTPPQRSRYTAEFKKDDGSWKIAAITESPLSSDAGPMSEPDEALAPLAWMTGTWIDKGTDFTVYYHCDWTPGGHSLSRSYALVTDGGIHSAGHELIRWDETAGRFQSQVSDSSGAITEAEWSEDGENSWIRKSSAVLADGTKASSVHKIRLIDENSFGLQIVDQSIAGEPVPDVEEVTVIKVSAKN